MKRAAIEEEKYTASGGGSGAGIPSVSSCTGCIKNVIWSSVSEPPPARLKEDLYVPCNGRAINALELRMAVFFLHRLRAKETRELTSEVAA